MTRAIIPPKLKPGSRIGIVATSSPIDDLGEEVVERGYQRLLDLGLEVVEAPNIRTRTGHTAGSIAARVNAIHGFLKDPDIDGIMAFWGGNQTHQLLEYLDYELFARHPKVIIGYSDFTPLLNTITSRTGLVTYCGPAVISFAKPTLFDDTTSWFRRALFEPAAPLDFQAAATISTNLWYEREDQQMIQRPSEGWKTFRPGLARGPLYGGNLGSLLLLAGTPYWPNLEGAILFVEEDESETPESMDRLFTRLRQMGVFAPIDGLVIGRLPDSVAFSERDPFEDILATALEGYDIPVLYDVDFGHTDPLLTIPIGMIGELDAGTGVFRVLEHTTVEDERGSISSKIDCETFVKRRDGCKDRTTIAQILSLYLGQSVSGIWQERFFDENDGSYSDDQGPLHIAFGDDILTFYGEVSTEKLTLLQARELVQRFGYKEDPAVYRWVLVDVWSEVFGTKVDVIFETYELLKDEFGVLAGITLYFSSGCLSFVSASDEHYLYSGKDCFCYREMKFERWDA